MKIAAFGEILWDIIGEKTSLGGAPLNFAAHAVKCGLPSAIISAFGEDELGKTAKDSIQNLGLDNRFLQLSVKETGTVQVKLKDGQPSYDIKEDVAYDYILSENLNFNLLKEFDCFYYGTLAQRNSASRNCLRQILEKSHFTTIFLDVNLRQSYYNQEILDYSFANCTILKLNDEEVVSLSNLIFQKDLNENEFAEKLVSKNQNISILILTKGADGCSIYHNKEWIHVPSQAVVVQDTIGAGDSFSAAFCVHYLKNKDVEAAAIFANKVGGFVASQQGAIPPYNADLL